MDKILHGPFSVRVPHFRKATDDERAAGATYWVENGAGVGTVSVEIDIDALVAELGPKALANKSGQSVEAGGSIVVRRLTCRYEPEANQ